MIINNKKISQVDFLKLLEDHKKKGYSPVLTEKPTGNDILITSSKGEVLNVYSLPAELSVSFLVQLKKTCKDRAKPSEALVDMSLSEFMARFDAAPKGGKIFTSSADQSRFYPKLVAKYLTLPLVPVKQRYTEAGIHERRLYNFSMHQYKTFSALIDALAVILSKKASNERKELIQDRLDSIN